MRYPHCMLTLRISFLALLVFVTACGNDAASDSSGDSSSDSSNDAGPSEGGEASWGEIFEGGEYHLGPVDWAQSQWNNACGPYPTEIQQLEGAYLAGVEASHTVNGELCDACVRIDANNGNSIVTRVITYGQTTPNSIDLSPEAFEMLDEGEYPRLMSWQVTKCPDTGNLRYQFQTGAHEYWSSLWIRNPRIAVEKVEVMSANHAEWFELTRAGDGTFTDAGGFGAGEFTLRVTSIDGQTVEDTFQSLPPGAVVESGGQFQ